MFAKSIRVTLPEVVDATEQRVLLTFEAEQPMTLETKKIPGFNGDRICRRQADSFWTGIWKAEDGRFFIVTDKEIEWFDTQAELLRTIANLMNLGER